MRGMPHNSNHAVIAALFAAHCRPSHLGQDDASESQPAPDHRHVESCSASDSPTGSGQPKGRGRPCSRLRAASALTASTR
jgi:hypothetical protein